MARPSKYETEVKPRFKEIEEWLSLGASEKEVFTNLGIGKDAFISYKKKYKEFSELIKKSRKKPVQQIKAAMLKRALGFQFTEKKTVKQKIKFPDEIQSILDENGICVSDKPTLVRVEETVKTALPDPTSGLILLKHWDEDTEWTGDPASLKIKKEELELKKEQINNDW